MDYNNPNNTVPPKSYDQREQSPSRVPLFLTLFVLGALAIVAIVAITPHNNAPLVTNDQVSPAAGDAASALPADSTTPMVDSGATTHMNEGTAPAMSHDPVLQDARPIPENGDSDGSVAP